MHLRVAHAFADLSLRHVFEESKGKDGALLVRQCGYQGTYRFDVETVSSTGSTSPRVFPTGWNWSSGPACTSVDRVE